MQSLETPRFTLILVRSILPTPSGSRQVCFLLAQIATFPQATSSIRALGSMFSFSATRAICGVRIPFLAASICVVYAIVFFSSIRILLKAGTRPRCYDLPHLSTSAGKAFFLSKKLGFL